MGLNPGPPARDASTLPLGYREGGMFYFDSLGVCHTICAVGDRKLFHTNIFSKRHFKKNVHALLEIKVYVLVVEHKV